MVKPPVDPASVAPAPVVEPPVEEVEPGATELPAEGAELPAEGDERPGVADALPPHEPLDELDPLARDDAAPADDLLDGTPDFLEETPEHERRWREQQPPRDFDFDE